MDKTKLRVVNARKGSILTESNFKGYDWACNPYVGCQFGCNYCYVRFFVKDAESEWGDFVRTRDHLATKLPKELERAKGQRIVLGTMTDPYQPQERKSRLTRMALRLINESKARPNKVGIFTRSPIVLDDLDEIAKLPRARVHFSVTPFPKDLMGKIERIAITTPARFRTVRALKAAGIRTHVSVAPAIPHLSDRMTEELATELAASNVDEFFVDPMQTYRESYVSLKEALKDDALWPEIEKTLQDPARFAAWKVEFRENWRNAWIAAGAPKTTLAIWCDHARHIWENLVTGETIPQRTYGDDLV